MKIKNKEHTPEVPDMEDLLTGHYIDLPDYSRLEHGIGSYAVRVRLEEANNNTDESPRDIYSRYLKNELKDTIRDTRSRIESLSPEDVAKANRYLGAGENWQGINALLGFDGSLHRHEYIQKITERDDDGVYTVSDETLANVLEWHNYHLADDQLEVENKSDRLKTKFKNRIKRSIKKGWAPEWLEDRLDQRLAETHVVADDGFLTHLRGFGGTAHRDDGVGFVTMQPENYQSRFWNGGQVLTHEFVHATDGYNGRKNGMYRIFSSHNREPGRVLNEAVVEHFSYSIHYNLPIDAIDPHSRMREGSSYVRERTLLDTLCTMGEKSIDIRLFIAAHFHHEDAERYEGKDPIDLLKAKLQEAFPTIDIIREMEERLKQESDLAEFISSLRERMCKPIQTKDEIAFNKRLNRRKTPKIVRLGLVAAGAAIAGSAISVGVNTIEHTRNDPKDTVTYDEAGHTPKYLLEEQYYPGQENYEEAYPEMLFDTIPSMNSSPEVAGSPGGVVDENTYPTPAVSERQGAPRSIVFNYARTPTEIVFTPSKKQSNGDGATTQHNESSSED